MLKVKQLYNYGASLVARVQGLHAYVFVSEYEELEDDIKNLSESQFPCLVFREPSGNSSGNEDNQTWSWQCLLYVLKKIDPSSETRETFLDKKSEMFDLVNEVKDLMIADMHNHELDANGIHFMHNLQTAGMHIDPENNFLGCIGYSLSFNLISE